MMFRKYRNIPINRATIQANIRLYEPVEAMNQNSEDAKRSEAMGRLVASLVEMESISKQELSESINRLATEQPEQFEILRDGMVPGDACSYLEAGEDRNNDVLWPDL